VSTSVGHLMHRQHFQATHHHHHHHHHDIIIIIIISTSSSSLSSSSSSSSAHHHHHHHHHHHRRPFIFLLFYAHPFVQSVAVDSEHLQQRSLPAAARAVRDGHTPGKVKSRARQKICRMAEGCPAACCQRLARARRVKKLIPGPACSQTLASGRSVYRCRLCACMGADMCAIDMHMHVLETPGAC
jgi:hypothetical protein